MTSDTFIAAPKATLTMAGVENAFGTLLRDLRKRAKLTQQQVANQLQLSHPAVQQWEAGKTYPSMENLLALANVVGPEILGFNRGQTAGVAEARLVEPNAEFEPGPVYLPTSNGPRDIEELGATMAGDAEDESAFEMNGHVVDLVKRPPGLMHRKDVFALRVTNVSMYPKFEDGERLFLEKRKPAIGDYVVVELYPLEEGRPGKSYVKKLVSANARQITVEQFNPHGILDFGRDEIKGLFRVIPQSELLGI